MSDEEKVVAEDEEAANEVDDTEEAEAKDVAPSEAPANAGVSDDLQILNERLGAPVSDVEEEIEIPTEDNTVVEIKAFLDDVDVEYPSSASKADLLELVKSWQ